MRLFIVLMNHVILNVKLFAFDLRSRTRGRYCHLIFPFIIIGGSSQCQRQVREIKAIEIDVEDVSALESAYFFYREPKFGS